MAESQSTPTKSKTKTYSATTVASPSSKRVMDFNVWRERKAKVAKRIMADLKEIKVKDLAVTKILEGKLTLRCLNMYDQGKVVKLSCDDGDKFIAVTAFENCADKLRTRRKNDVFELACFEVKKQKPGFFTGSHENLELILLESSTLKAVDATGFPPVPYLWKSLEEVKDLPDTTVIDVLAVVGKNFGTCFTSTGKQKLDISVTDYSKECMRVALWGTKTEELSEVQYGEAVAFRRICVTSYLGAKMLNCGWYTHIQVNPEISDGAEMVEWFHKTMEESEEEEDDDDNGNA